MAKSKPSNAERLKRVGPPQVQQHHKPVRFLYNKKGSHVGYICQHCDMILTTNYSESLPTRNKGLIQGGKVVTNKNHVARLDAALELK